MFLLCCIKHVVLLQSGNNRSGILRSVVKDFNDANANSTLDSDGNYNDDGALGPNAAFTNVSNGGWHMATLTTRTDVQHGYLLYIDGQVAGVSHAQNKLVLICRDRQQCSDRTHKLAGILFLHCMP